MTSIAIDTTTNHNAEPVVRFPKDYSASGIKLIGAWENDRNADNRQLIHDVLAKVLGPAIDVLVAHHLCYGVQDGDQFIVEEIPSFDALLFDHDIARNLWGANYLKVLANLAVRTVNERDAQFRAFFYGVQGNPAFLDEYFSCAVS